MKRLATLALMSLAACSGPGQLLDLKDDKYHGCGGAEYASLTGGYIVHIGEIPAGATLIAEATPASCKWTLTMPGSTPAPGSVVNTGPTTVNMAPAAKTP